MDKGWQRSGEEGEKRHKRDEKETAKEFRRDEEEVENGCMKVGLRTTEV